jgi:hypothetical protein
MLRHWKKVGWALLAVWLTAGCAEPVANDSVPPGTYGTTSAEHVWLVQKSGDENLLLRPVHPVTLADLPGHEPIGSGHHFDRAVSPDRKKMAMVSWPGDDQERGVLKLIDLSAWKEQRVGMALNRPVVGLNFSPDGKTLYWLMPDSSGTPENFALYRYRPKDRKWTVLHRFPRKFEPREMVMLDKEPLLAVYGSELEGKERIAQVHAFDPVSGRTLFRLRLDGIREGTVPRELPDEDVPVLDAHQAGLAWDLQRNRLYVVGGEPRRLIRVDLSEGKVTLNQPIGVDSSWWERIVDWLLPGTEAKMMAGTIREAELDPDGKRLYVLEREYRVEKENGRPSQRINDSGLIVIDLEKAKVEGRISVSGGQMKVAPNRRLLIAGSWHVNSPKEQQGGLYFLDPETVRVSARLEPGVIFAISGFSPDGRYAYVSTDQSVKVLDLEKRRFVAVRQDALDVLAPGQ